METKAKKKFGNIIMVVLILIIAASGVLTVGKIQGWFDKPEEAVITCATVKGVANIERKGIGYTLNSDTVLQSEDIVETKKGAQVQMNLKEADRLVLNGNTQVQFIQCGEEQTAAEIQQGEMFGAVSAYEGTLNVTFDGHKAMLSGAVFSSSVQAGSSSLNIYAGDVSVFLSDGVQERVEAGEHLSVVHEEDGSISYEITDLQAGSLSEFLIAQIQETGDSLELCFSGEQLQSVLNARAAEKQAALEASLKAEVITARETEETVSESEKTPVETVAHSPVEEYAPESNVQQQAPVQDRNICTITILCDTILDNMDNLDDGKEAYVPANGTILATSNVEFEEGETVFDVLNRVCEYAGIQLEYSWTPMYNSYYIEGINNLYEFDCGNESGWMYKVNGWFPNYGCSSYSLEDGDNIVWCYTCNGLGADVGGRNY